jgi:hypothetical protein
MKYKYKKTLVLSSLVLGGFMFLDLSTGPANGGYSVSGAPFGTFGAGTYCSNCHGGGSFAPTVTAQLLSGGTVVPNGSNYVAGWPYTLRITRTANASFSLLPNSGFGFQVTCATTSGSTNVNAWGTPPANTAIRLLSGRNYVEHTTKLSKNITQVDIPWTGPANGTGPVTFYLALNTVNGDGGTSGDQPITTTANFTQAPLSVTWLYFRGFEKDNKNILEWATSSEINNDHFTIERSEDGINYTLLTTVKSPNDGLNIHHYSFADESPAAKTFYRIKQTDHNGYETYFRTIQVERLNKLNLTSYSLNGQLIIKIQSPEEEFLDVALYGIDGRKASFKTFQLTRGENRLTLEQPDNHGIYTLRIIRNGQIIHSGKVLIEK